MRPDQVADELHGSVGLDCIVLITVALANEEINALLSSRDIYEYSYDKHGSDLNATLIMKLEVKDMEGRIVLPKGQVVDYNFKSPKPKGYGSNIVLCKILGQWFRSDGYKDKYNKISFIEYETEENEKKRAIYVLRKSYLQQFK